MLARLYRRHLLPRLVHLACGLEPAMRQRARIVPLAEGRVLEVGLGSGLNLAFYDPARVMRVLGLDPSPEMWARTGAEPATLSFEFGRILAGAEHIPLEEAAVDSVVMTYTLCSIPDAAAALGEVRRVLAPGGRLLFCEHGLAPHPAGRRWQRRLDPIWRPLAGGCHLDRDIPGLLAAAGFECVELERGYIEGWRPASFNYWGVAVPG